MTNIHTPLVLDKVVAPIVVASLAVYTTQASKWDRLDTKLEKMEGRIQQRFDEMQKDIRGVNRDFQSIEG